MALHDFYCPRCPRVLVDINVPISIGAQAGAPSCPDCGGQTAWIPQVGRMDAYEPFQEFTTTDGRGKEVLVDSLHRLRKVEEEAEAAYRNGEGQPMVWRRYSQDVSNQDQHTLHRSYDGSEQPTEEAKRRFGQTLRRGDAAAEGEYGPGVSDANTSALGEGF